MATGKKKEVQEEDKKAVTASQDYSLLGAIDLPPTPTGVLPVDILLKGGITPGMLYAVYSDSGVGKTTLILSIAKKLIQYGDRVAFFDVENGVSDDLRKKMGLFDNAGTDLNTSEFFFIKPRTYKQTWTAFKDVAAAGFKFVFIDSMTALSTADEIDGEPNNTIGLSARLDGDLYKNIKALSFIERIATVVVQQKRIAAKGRFFVNDSAGGNASRFYPDARIELTSGEKIVTKKETINGKEEVVIGNNARIVTKKYRGGDNGISVPCPIIFGKGVLNSRFVLEVLRSNGYINQGGAYFTIKVDGQDPVKALGLVATMKEISSKLDFYVDFLKSKNLLTLTQGGEDDEV